MIEFSDLRQQKAGKFSVMFNRRWVGFVASIFVASIFVGRSFWIFSRNLY